MNVTLRNFLMPLKCPVCQEILSFGNEGDGVMCQVCRTKWTLEKRRSCPECGMMASNCRCMPDELKRAGAAALLKLCFYNTSKGSAADRLILYLKDYNDKRVFRYIAAELCRSIKEHFNQNQQTFENVLFTYSPRSRGSFTQKGFDQARMLSKYCANHLGVAFGITVKRSLFGRQQKGLSVKKRDENAKRSFVVEKGIHLEGATVVLIDDVVTTGASLAACTKILRAAGAEKVICVAIARAERLRD